MDKRNKMFAVIRLHGSLTNSGILPYNPDQMEHCFWKKTFGEGKQMF